MQVILKINDRGNVRDAVPLRAIPYVTSWKDSPDGIVRTLAAPKTVRVGSLEITSRNNELFAYQIDAQGNFEKVPPEQWESWVVTLDSLTKKSQADERDGAENENHAIWRIKAVLELPDNVFIWLDEFQRWHSNNRPSDAPDDYLNNYLKWESNRESLLAKLHDPNSELSESEWAMLDEASPELEQENDRLCLSPILPPEIEDKVWRYPVAQFNIDVRVDAVNGHGAGTDDGQSPAIPEAPEGAETPPPVLRQRFQEQEILRIIADLKYSAGALPKAPNGKKGVKAEVRYALKFPSGVFDKAWERLRAQGEIQDAE